MEAAREQKFLKLIVLLWCKNGTVKTRTMH